MKLEKRLTHNSHLVKRRMIEAGNVCGVVTPRHQSSTCHSLLMALFSLLLADPIVWLRYGLRTSSVRSFDMFRHIVWYSFIEHVLILRSDHNWGAILFAVLYLSSRSYYLLPFRSSSENMIRKTYGLVNMIRVLLWVLSV